jgi:polyisoprenyl-teichoic acid--peptidoglycan teichoic acid transferase
VNPEGVPREGLRMLVRGGLAALLIVLVTATAVAVGVIREVEDIVAPLQGRATIEIPELDRADAGGARTFLILGSDKRKGVDADSPPRSDTMLLVRADPDKDAITVMSVPRDLRVEIPGFGSDKINAAYEYGGRKGGPRLVTRTIKQLFENATGENFPITNVLVLDYEAFREAVDRIDGVYVDIDRDYFNDKSSGQNYATIDIDPGYQLLRGRDALDYVRYRHTDNDFVRAARQQDFLRQAQNDSDARALLSLGESRRLVRIFSNYFETDKSLSSTQEIFSLLKLLLFLAGENPKVNEVRFRAREAENPQVDSNLSVTTGALRRMYREFMSTEGSATPRRSSKPTEEDREFERLRGRRKRQPGPVPDMEDSRSEGESMAVLADPKLDFPFYFPAVRRAGSAYEGTEARIYKIRDEKGKKHQAYRLTLRAPGVGEYYGIQGLRWKTPPILDNPDETVERDGRRFMLFFDGRQLRMVAWRTKRAVYWVSNTLTQNLSQAQMLEIAGSLRRLNQ